MNAIDVRQFARLTAVLVGTALLATCTAPRHQPQTVEATPTPAATAASSPERPRPSDLELLRKFAESYEPQPAAGTVIPDAPIPSEELKAALSRLAASGTREHEKFVLLIFVKLERYHLRKFKQTYNLDASNPLTTELARIIDTSNLAELLSGAAGDHVRKNPELLGYKPLADEMSLLRKVEAELERKSPPAR